MSTEQSQTELNSFEGIRKVRLDECLLIYDGDLDGVITVINKTKGTNYTIHDDECSCDGFKYRGECKHLSGLELLRQSQGDQL